MYKLVIFDHGALDCGVVLPVADCRDALAYYYPTTGVYPVNPSQVGRPFNAYCDMDDGQGWTLLLRREDGSTDFYRSVLPSGLIRNFST